MVAFYKHHIPSWMDGTEKLADGPYRALHVICQLIYLNEGPIEFNEKGIAGRCNQHILSFRHNIGVLLDLGKLSLADGKLSNNRAATELKLVDNHRETSAKGGRHSAGVKKGSHPDRQSKSLKNIDPEPSQLLDQQHHKTRQDETREERKKDGAEAPVRLDREEVLKRCYSRGREILGAKSGGIITKLLRAKNDNPFQVLATLEQSADKGDPMQYIGGALRKGNGTISGVPGSDQYTHSLL